MLCLDSLLHLFATVNNGYRMTFPFIFKQNCIRDNGKKFRSADTDSVDTYITKALNWKSATEKNYNYTEKKHDQ